jgi:RNA polymerase sigma factor (TIGR02999 family)
MQRRAGFFLFQIGVVPQPFETSSQENNARASTEAMDAQRGVGYYDARMNDVTQVLDRIRAGDPGAAEQLLPLVYNELRKLAAMKMTAESPGHSLDATALVHEAYLRLVGGQQFDGRGHFFAAAAEAMRRILVESARRKRCLKNGGDRDREALELDDVAAPEATDELLAVDEALTNLAVAEPHVADLVKLRYFVGLTIPQAAAHLGISPRTADVWWAFAKAWIQDDMKGRSKSF